MINKLRLIYDSSCPASCNMAADEALFQGLLEETSPPTLRFYRWSLPTVSIGYFQAAAKEIDLDRLAQQNMAFVRRPTGGRAVLHWKEVTFCLTLPTKNLGLWDIFRTVHEAIGVGLRQAGIPAEVLPADREKLFNGAEIAKDHTASCFASPSRYELSINGKKVAGTAQKQVKSGILIHGSLPIFSTYRELFDVLVFENEEEREAAYLKSMEKMTSIYDETKREFTFDEIRDRMIEGFASRWNCTLEPGSITHEEQERIAFLEREKFNNPAWLLKK